MPQQPKTTTRLRRRPRRRKSLVRCIAAAVAAILASRGGPAARPAEGFSRPLGPRVARQRQQRRPTFGIPDWSAVAAGGGGDAAGVTESPPSRAAAAAAALFLEDFFANLDGLYDRSSSIRCPFFRRRAADAVDGLSMIARFLLIRHKSLGIFDPLFFLDDDVAENGHAPPALPPGCRAVGRHVAKNDDGTVLKHRNMEVSDVADVVRRDWAERTGGKGYYVTGRLNSTVYRDDCLFYGPDPDMPVRGLRKYLSAASHLFDAKQSYAELLSLEFEETGGKYENGCVIARWKLGGVLMLPWRPVVKPWTGTTKYHLDEERLVRFHEEEWDISVAEAFVCTIWPEVGERIWG